MRPAAAALDTVEGGERVLLGAYAARTGERLRNLLRVTDEKWTTLATPVEKTKLLATELAAATSAQWAIVVGDTQRDERGAGFVEVVFRHPDGRLESQRFAFRSGDAGHGHLTTQLLDQLRRRLR
jgi:hypothetical protein